MKKDDKNGLMILSGFLALLVWRASKGNSTTTNTTTNTYTNTTTKDNNTSTKSEGSGNY